MNGILLLALALVLLGSVVWMTTARTQPIFNDKAQMIKTIIAEDSSYAQQTNHMEPSAYSMGPIAGVQTPFQVNQYRAHM